VNVASKKPYALRVARWAALCLFVIAPCLAPLPAQALPLIELRPSLSSVDVGNGFTIDVNAVDVTDLFAYQIDITFDPLAVEAGIVSDGGFLTSGGGLSVFGGLLALTIDNTLGVITILDALTGPAPPASGVTGTGLLATLGFTARSAGSTQIGLTNVIAEDASGAPIELSALQGAAVDVTSVATPVPEPGTLLLVSSALALVASKARRRR
jgi:hypothetical protein